MIKASEAIAPYWLQIMYLDMTTHYPGWHDAERKSYDTLEHAQSAAREILKSDGPACIVRVNDDEHNVVLHVFPLKKKATGATHSIPTGRPPTPDGNPLRVEK